MSTFAVYAGLARLLVTSFALACTALAARADLQLSFAVTQQTDTPANGTPASKPAHTETTYSLTVVLGDDYYTSRTNDVVMLCDFAERRVHYLDLKAKTYLTYSMYSDVGFRVAELPNRLMMQQVTGAVAAVRGSFEKVLMEHDLSLRAPDAAPLTSVSGSGGLIFRYGDKTLFTCNANGTAVSASEAASFVRFLRYACPAHPDILTSLEQRHSIPAEFDLYHYRIESDHFHFRLVKAEPVARSFDAAAALNGLKRRDTEVSPICAAADAISPAQFEAKCAELIQAAVHEADAKHYLESALLFTEYVLSSGRAFPSEFQSYREAIQADPAAKLFFASVRPRDKAASAKAAVVMQQLRASATKGKAVLKIHEADHLTAAGNPYEAQKLFREALTEAPWIVGAWKDLGDLYYGAFDARLAWQCWDAGRRLLPSQKQFMPVDDFERRLVSEHPEYF